MAKSLKKHLKTVRNFLGYKGNPIVHKILDGAEMPKKYRLIYHRTTHTPEFIEKTIKPFGKNAELEAWCHLFEDWNLI